MSDEPPEIDLTLVPTAALINEFLSRHDSAIIGGYMRPEGEGKAASVVDFYGSHHECVSLCEELKLEILLHLKANQHERHD